MADFTLTLASGRSVVLDLAEDGEGPACFLLSVRKCGSSLANNICAMIAYANQRGFVNFGHSMFQNNILIQGWQRDPAIAQMLRPGLIYGGFRDAPLALFDNTAFVQGRKVVVIRDPRDALVSEYFSNAYSHPLPADGNGSDDVKKHLLQLREKIKSRTMEQELVIRAPQLARSIMNLAPVLSMPNVVVAKYEDFVFEKTKLMQTLGKQFGMAIGPALIERVLSQTDKFPDEENPQAFVRQVRPGDHRRKLTPDVIAKLNTMLAEPMALFGYPAAAPDA